jgi:hypothetical protein
MLREQCITMESARQSIFNTILRMTGKFRENDVWPLFWDQDSCDVCFLSHALIIATRWASIDFLICS